MIKEIIDHFPESEYTLKDIVKARFRTRDVEDAITYLDRKAAKRRKREEPRGDDAPSHQDTKNTHIGRIDAFNNMHSNSSFSGAEAFADQNTSRPPKLSVLSKGREDVAADTDDSSTGSTVSGRQPSGGAPTEYKVPSGNSGGRYFSSFNREQFGQVTDQDLYGVDPEGNQQYGVTQQSFDARHSTAPQAGPSYASKQLNHDVHYSTAPVSGSRYEVNQYHQDPRYSTVSQTGPSYYSDNTEGSQHHHRVPPAGRPLFSDGTKNRMDSAMTTSHSDPRGHAVVTQSNTVLPSNVSYTNGYSKSSSRTETRVHESASGNSRYANVRDIGSYADQKFGSNESDKRMSTKESARRHDDRDAKYGQTGSSSSEPMEVEQSECSRESRNDATSLYNGMAEGAYGKPSTPSGVTDLNATLRHQLSLEPNLRLAGKESKQICSSSSEHRRQHGSESVASAQEAAGSRGGITGGAQPTRLLFQTGSNFTSHTADKSEVQGSSTVPSWRTSAQRDRAQNPAHSSNNDRGTEASHKGKAPQTDVKRDDNAKCDQCMLEGTIICINCRRVVCRKCREIYVADLCGATKGDHVFTDLKDNKLQYSKSVDSRASSSQPHTNVNEGFVSEENEWPCSRCTYLNPPDHKICAMCAATRGVGPVELTQAGSRVCRNCTYHNQENATVCRACHKTLDLHPTETSV